MKIGKSFEEADDIFDNNVLTVKRIKDIKNPMYRKNIFYGGRFYNIIYLYILIICSLNIYVFILLIHTFTKIYIILFRFLIY